MNKEEALELYVGEKLPYYERKWQRGTGQERKQPKPISWNVGAFFGFYWWAAGRGMFNVLFIVLIAFLFLDIFMIMTGLDFNSQIGIAMAVAFGIGGNQMYYVHVEKKIKKMLASGCTRKELINAGGFKWSRFFAGVGFTVVYLIIAVFISFIFE
ncbi:DUF2628 domain-containing protein [Bacillus sp. JCM 19041]|uniref:DUF2628 domain-containing protein n=1 Tax=Bacillus sp. JCM 19041 TaxID=1460637 RepID=UPI0009E692CF